MDGSVMVGLMLLVAGAGGCLLIGFGIKRNIELFEKEKQFGIAIIVGYERNGSDLEPVVSFTAGGKKWARVAATGNVTYQSHPKGSEIKIAYRLKHYTLVGPALAGVEVAEPEYQSKSSKMFFVYAAWVMSALFAIASIGIIIGGLMS